jgi:glycosyltransferase involved in cell wall biosynthesis
MNEIPEILTFMKKIRPWYPRMLASVANTCQHPYTLRVQYDSNSTAFKACNDVIKRSNSRYICICDDDVEFIEDNWLLTLVDILKKYENFGCVVPVEIKTEEQLATFHELGHDKMVSGLAYVWSCSVAPGYVTMFDRLRVPSLYCDENMPGYYGMSDIDLAMQVRDAGYDVGMTSAVIVTHMRKSNDPGLRKEWGLVQEEDLTMNTEQRHYMRQKWGDLYMNTGKQVIFEKFDKRI